MPVIKQVSFVYREWSILLGWNNQSRRLLELLDKGNQITLLPAFSGGRSSDNRKGVKDASKPPAYRPQLQRSLRNFVQPFLSIDGPLLGVPHTLPDRHVLFLTLIFDSLE
jgi:hypothetical protein